MWHDLTDSLPVPLDDAHKPTHGVASARGEPRILLLDDDPFMLGMLSRMLRTMGYRMVGTASSGYAALGMLRADPRAVDVVVCDLNMPGMDGIEFLQTLSASVFRGSVILLSGEGPRIMQSVQILLGGNLKVLGALEKPAERTALRSLLDRWKPQPESPAIAPIHTIGPDEIQLANRERQWALHYQPSVDLQTGAVRGVEALIRWNHPRHGLVYPSTFVPMAEASGAISALTDWVLQEATEQLERWHRTGLELRMAVNVSMESLRCAGFAGRISSLLRRACTSASDLTLEITESRLMDPSPAPLENLVRLRMQRFGLSIDDFGTGHSSLAQLRDVPFTELKIDRGFVRGARHNQVIRPILEASVGIAKRLAMQSVGEGVETEDD